MTHTRIGAERQTVACALTLAILALGCTGDPQPIRIERAAAALAAGGATATMYFTIHNDASRADTIVELEVDAAGIAGFQATSAHRDLGNDTIAVAPLVVEVPAVIIPARGTLRLTPGGYTATLIGLRRVLRPGDSLRLTVHLSSGVIARAMVPVVAYADLDTALAPVDARPAAAARLAPPSVEEGRALYRANGCITCHGPTGHGDGTLAKTLNPPPRDFRDGTAFRSGSNEANIARTLAAGITGGGAMPLYAHLTENERHSIALFVLSLRTSTFIPRTTIP